MSLGIVPDSALPDDNVIGCELCDQTFAHEEAREAHHMLAHDSAPDFDPANLSSEMKQKIFLEDFPKDRWPSQAAAARELGVSGQDVNRWALAAGLAPSQQSDAQQVDASVKEAQDALGIQIMTEGPQPRYTEEFKLRMVELSDADGVTVSHVARKYGFDSSSLYGWRKAENRVSSKKPAKKRVGPGQGYSAEVKAAALARVDAGEKPGLVAVDIGVTSTTIHQWRRTRDKDKNAAPAAPETEVDMFAEVKDEVMTAKEQRERIEELTAALDESHATVERLTAELEIFEPLADLYRRRAETDSGDTE